MKTTFIYTYMKGNQAYVGRTRDIDRRKAEHRFYNRFIGWEHSVIDSVDSDRREDWAPLEIYWIEQFRQWGYLLKNTTKGGDGMIYQSDQTKSKMSATLKGKPKSSEHIANISAALKGRTLSEEHIAKLSAAGKNRTHSEESKSKMSAARKGKPGRIQSEETKAKLSAARKAYYEVKKLNK